MPQVITRSFAIKQNDRLPHLVATLFNDAAGLVPADLTLASRVDFVFKNTATGIVRRGEAIVVTANQVRYEWREGDTAEAGFCLGEFEAHFQSRPLTYPSDTYLGVEIVPDLSS